MGCLKRIFWFIVIIAGLSFVAKHFFSDEVEDLKDNAKEKIENNKDKLPQQKKPPVQEQKPAVQTVSSAMTKEQAKSNYLEFYLEDGTYLIESNSKALNITKDVIVPSTIDGIPVTKAILKYESGTPRKITLPSSLSLESLVIQTNKNITVSSSQLNTVLKNMKDKVKNVTDEAMNEYRPIVINVAKFDSESFTIPSRLKSVTLKNSSELPIQIYCPNTSIIFADGISAICGSFTAKKLTFPSTIRWIGGSKTQDQIIKCSDIQLPASLGEIHFTGNTIFQGCGLDSDTQRKLKSAGYKGKF